MNAKVFICMHAVSLLQVFFYCGGANDALGFLFLWFC